MRLTPCENHWFVSVDLENSDRVYSEALTATRDEYLARAARDACKDENRARWLKAQDILIQTARCHASREEAAAFALELERRTGVPMKIGQAFVLHGGGDDRQSAPPTGGHASPNRKQRQLAGVA